jgi:hypothetical protein
MAVGNAKQSGRESIEDRSLYSQTRAVNMLTTLRSRARLPSGTQLSIVALIGWCYMFRQVRD